MLQKEFKIHLQMLFVILSILSFNICGCSRAPEGAQGFYNIGGRDSTSCLLKNVTKDIFFSALRKEGLVVKSDRLHDYDPPWDSIHYVISDIYCDHQIIDAYIEYNDKQTVDKRLIILGFKAKPTYDNNLYFILVERYYHCFKSLLRKNNLIK